VTEKSKDTINQPTNPEKVQGKGLKDINCYQAASILCSIYYWHPTPTPTLPDGFFPETHLDTSTLKEKYGANSHHLIGYNKH
jgi:hypothetical protein